MIYVCTISKIKHDVERALFFYVDEDLRVNPGNYSMACLKPSEELVSWYKHNMNVKDSFGTFCKVYKGELMNQEKELNFIKELSYFDYNVFLIFKSINQNMFFQKVLIDAFESMDLECEVL